MQPMEHYFKGQQNPEMTIIKQIRNHNKLMTMITRENFKQWFMVF